MEPIGELFVEENEPARLIVSVNAGDADAGANGRVSIALLPAPEHAGLFRLSSSITSSTSLSSSSSSGVGGSKEAHLLAASTGGGNQQRPQVQPQTQVHLWTTRALDREAAPAHVLTLRLTDHGTPARTTDVSFVVRCGANFMVVICTGQSSTHLTYKYIRHVYVCRVLDVNDNPPEVVEPRAGHESTITLHLHGTGAASKVAGETIGGVRARDADSGVNAELRYAIEPACRILDRSERSSDARTLSGGRPVKRDVQSSEAEREKGAAMSERALSLVRVEVATGKLYLARPLEAADAGAHRLCVRISDGGHPPLETLTELLLVIRNGSDHTAESFGALDATALGASRRNAQSSDVGGKMAEVGHRMADAVDRVVWKEDAAGDGGRSGSAMGRSGGELDWTHLRPAVLWIACTLMLATLVLLCALVAAIAYRRSKDKERMSPLSLRIPHEFAVSPSAHNRNHHRFYSNSNSNPNLNSNGIKAAIGAQSSSHRQLVRGGSHSQSHSNQNINHCQVDCYESRSPARSISRAVRPARLSSTARPPVSASAAECSQRIGISTPRSPYLCVEPMTPSRKQSTNSCLSEVTTREPLFIGLNSRNEHAIVYRMDSNEHSIICRVNSNERSIVSRLNSGNLQRMDSAECEETFSRLRRHMSLTPDIYSACLQYENC